VRDAAKDELQQQAIAVAALIWSAAARASGTSLMAAQELLLVHKPVARILHSSGARRITC